MQSGSCVEPVLDELQTPHDDRPEQEQVQRALEELKPWRKGPYNFFGTEVDTEWRSNLKWERIAGHIDDFFDFDGGHPCLLARV